MLRRIARERVEDAAALAALIRNAQETHLVGCGTATDTPPATGLPAPTSTSSASESGYFVDWKSPAQSQVQQWEAEGRSDDEARIASERFASSIRPFESSQRGVSGRRRRNSTTNRAGMARIAPSGPRM